MSDLTAEPVSSSLPVLFSVRCWNDKPDAGSLAFAKQMRSTGVAVDDIYVPPAGFGDLDEWARAVIEVVESRRDPAVPLHLMAYCGGGNITLAALHQLEAAGVFPEFVAFIDVREDQESYRLERGIDAINQVPWGVRFRCALIRLTPPDRESLGQVVRSVVRRSIRSVRELPKRGWRSRKRRKPYLFEVLRLTYPWEFDGVVTPVHTYNTLDSIQRYGAGDPSLNIGRNLFGGFLVRIIEGSHENCIEPPYSAALIERINADRRAVVAGEGAFQ
jgi:thioesterase domain-containing protein